MQTEKYKNKIQNSYEILNKVVPKFEKTNSSFYHNYLKKIFKKVKEKKDELEGKDINSNNNESLGDIKCGENIYNQEESNINCGYKQEQTTQNIEINEKPIETKEDLPTCIRKSKKSVRRINKLKKLYKEIEKEKNEDLSKPNDKRCSCLYIVFFINLFIVVLTDFVLPIAFAYNFNDDYIKNEDYEKEESIVSLIAGLLVLIPVSVLCSSYTIITIYSTTRRRYITGDFLSSSNINDSLSLLKTVQLVCGYSFALVYCNFYFWKAIDKLGDLGKPKFYEKTIIPDYTFKSGISIYMIVKIIIIICSIIASLKLNKVFVFKNDLAEYNLGQDNNMLDNDKEFENFLVKYEKINNYLNK